RAARSKPIPTLQALSGQRGCRHRAPQELSTGPCSPRALAQYAAEIPGAGLAAVESEHVARDRAEALAPGERALAVTPPERDERCARGQRARLRRQRPLQFGQYERPVIGLAA